MTQSGRAATKNLTTDSSDFTVGNSPLFILRIVEPGLTEHRRAGKVVYGNKTFFQPQRCPKSLSNST